MKKTAVIDRAICVACGVCAKACPRDAISIYKGCFAQINEDTCVGCGLCGKACPAGCITVQEREGVR